MTTPTAFSLSPVFSVGDTLTFASGVNQQPPAATQSTMNLFGVATNGVVLPADTICYLNGSYDSLIGVFTVGGSGNTLFWVGTPEEFSDVNRTGGNWQLAT